MSCNVIWSYTIWIKANQVWSPVNLKSCTGSKFLFKSWDEIYYHNHLSFIVIPRGFTLKPLDNVTINHASELFHFNSCHLFTVCTANSCQINTNLNVFIFPKSLCESHLGLDLCIASSTCQRTRLSPQRLLALSFQFFWFLF